jgi:hypothetical protein
MLTGKQKVALMLERAGYTDSEIARHMGLRHREAASQLLARARKAWKRWQQLAIEYFEEGDKLEPPELRRQPVRQPMRERVA